MQVMIAKWTSRPTNAQPTPGAAAGKGPLATKTSTPIGVIPAMPAKTNADKISRMPAMAVATTVALIISLSRPFRPSLRVAVG
jgi:hypothetical protein